MKFYASQNVFQFPWHEVAEAFWARYPNPYSKHVLSVDTISRKVIGSKMYCTRLIVKANSVKLPRLMERFVPSLGKNPMCIVEETIVDRKNKTLTTYSRNIVMTRILSIEEKCVYKCSEEDNNKWTLCDRKAWIQSSLVSRYGIAYAIQAYGADRFKRSVTATLRGYDHILRQMFPEATPPSVTSKTHHLSNIRDKARDKVNGLKVKAVHVVSSNTNLSG